MASTFLATTIGQENAEMIAYSLYQVLPDFLFLLSNMYFQCCSSPAISYQPSGKVSLLDVFKPNYIRLLPGAFSVNIRGIETQTLLRSA